MTPDVNGASAVTNADFSKMEINVVLAGVGGQGTLVAGKLLGILAIHLGLDVKVSEVHGMSQRGGSVITYVKIGRRVFSPIIEKGSADYCLAFEELEALRWSGLLKENGVLIVNSQKIKPLPVLMGKAAYPDHIEASLTAAAGTRASVKEFDALDAALSVGSSKAVNMVMLGALSSRMPIPVEMWEKAVSEVFAGKEKLIPMNLKAFHAGRELMR
jgi:indolepyruvate ferredoxin oxidoreductase, beta subunit